MKITVKFYVFFFHFEPSRNPQPHMCVCNAHHHCQQAVMCACVAELDITYVVFSLSRIPPTSYSFSRYPGKLHARNLRLKNVSFLLELQKRFVNTIQNFFTLQQYFRIIYILLDGYKLTLANVNNTQLLNTSALSVSKFTQISLQNI